jgi:hypothetical protein
MRLSPQPTMVRRIVIKMFRRFGAETPSLFEMEEELLLDEGRDLARTYCVDGLMAMWFLEIGIVQFYDDDGNMLGTVNLFEELVPQRMAV